MNNNTIEQQVFNIIIEQLCLEKSQIKLESAIIKDLEGDSLDYIEIIMAIEAEFPEIPEITPENMKSFKTVNHLVEYITEHTS